MPEEKIVLTERLYAELFSVQNYKPEYRKISNDYAGNKFVELRDLGLVKVFVKDNDTHWPRYKYVLTTKGVNVLVDYELKLKKKKETINKKRIMENRKSIDNLIKVLPDEQKEQVNALSMLILNKSSKKAAEKTLKQISKQLKRIVGPTIYQTLKYLLNSYIQETIFPE